MNKESLDLSWFDDKFHPESGTYFLMKEDASTVLHHQASLQFLARHIRTLKKCNFLDIGCACGDFTNQVAVHFEPEFSLGIDFSTTGIQEARNRYPTLDFEVQSIQEVTSARKYNLICCMDVLYYLSEKDIVAALSNILKLLSSDGFVLISISTVGNKNSISNADFVRLVTRDFCIIDDIGEPALFQAWFAKKVRSIIRKTDQFGLRFISSFFYYLRSRVWIAKINYFLCSIVLPKKGITKQLYLLRVK